MNSRLDPTLIVPQQWAQIATLINDAYLMAALLIVAFAALMVAHGMIPSLVASHDAPAGLAKLRPVFYIVFVAALCVGLYAMARMFHLIVVFAGSFYPRFGY